MKFLSYFNVELEDIIFERITDMFYDMTAKL